MSNNKIPKELEPWIEAKKKTSPFPIPHPNGEGIGNESKKLW